MPCPNKITNKLHLANKEREMPRDFSKPPRAGDGPKRDGYKPGGSSRKPWERRERPQGEERPFRKPYAEKREFGEARRDFRPPRFDEELFAASGKVADIVGPGAQSRYEMLRKLWDFFRSEDLIVPAGHHPRPNAEDWRHGGGEHRREEQKDRPPNRGFRKPAGEHPTARRRNSLEGVPRRKFKETREK
jgi:hypothetical protein